MNKVILAVAGSGKTTRIVKEALKIVESNSKKVLIISYTINGKESILQIIKENNNGVLHDKIDVKSWYSFLLNDCIKPYQKDFNLLISAKGYIFEEYGTISYLKKDNVSRYFTKDYKVLSNHASEFVVECSKKNHALFCKRLSEIYSDVFIDEVQDLNGEDLEVLELIMNAELNLKMVGDHRQATFNTHISTKYKKYEKSNIKEIFLLWQKEKKVQIETINECNRSNQIICDFADKLYPNESATKSVFMIQDKFDGVYLIEKKDVPIIVEILHPFLLRWNKKTDSLKYPCCNFGESKALTKLRTLLFPTKPFVEFVKDNNKTLSDCTKYYVALTRARHTVFIVVEKLFYSSEFIPFQLNISNDISLNTSKFNNN